MSNKIKVYIYQKEEEKTLYFQKNKNKKRFGWLVTSGSYSLLEKVIVDFGW